MKKKKIIFSPIGWHELTFVKDLLDLYISQDLTSEELSFYFDISLGEINDIIDLYLNIYLTTGSLQYKYQDPDKEMTNENKR